MVGDNMSQCMKFLCWYMYMFMFLCTYIYVNIFNRFRDFVKKDEN